MARGSPCTTINRWLADGRALDEAIRRSSSDVPLWSCSWASTELDAQALSQKFAVVGGVAEEQPRTLRALEVEVRVVFPRESDATMNLNVLRRAVEVRLGTERLRQARGDREFVVALLRGPGRVVGGGLSRLDVEQHVRALVLDRLERTDRPTELHTVLRVLDRVVEDALRATDLFGGQCGRGHLQRRLETRERLPLDADEPRRSVTEHEATLLACLVHGRQRFARDALRVAVDGEERKTLGRHRRHQEERRGAAVRDVAPHAIEYEAVARRPRGRC